MKLRDSNPAISAEAMALNKAIAKSGLTKAAIAGHLKVTPSLVSQWGNGLRPVPSDHATMLGKLLQVDPRTISVAFKKAYDAPGGREAMRAAMRTYLPEGKAKRTQAEGAASPYDLAGIQDLEEKVQALTLAVGVLAATMVSHRPAEAREAAQALRKKVPEHLLRTGLLRDLLALLDH